MPRHGFHEMLGGEFRSWLDRGNVTPGPAIEQRACQRRSVAPWVPLRLPGRTLMRPPPCVSDRCIVTMQEHANYPGVSFSDSLQLAEETTHECHEVPCSKYPCRSLRIGNPRCGGGRRLQQRHSTSSNEDSRTGGGISHGEDVRLSAPGMLRHDPSLWQSAFPSAGRGRFETTSRVIHPCPRRAIDEGQQRRRRSRHVHRERKASLLRCSARGASRDGSGGARRRDSWQTQECRRPA